MAGNDMRDKARAVREADDAAQKRRDRLVGLIGGIVVAVVVVAIVVASIAAKNKKQDLSSAKLPAGVSKVDFGVPYGSVKSGVPRVDVYEDFQCPACKMFEPINGYRLVDMAKAGKLSLVWHPAAFLDSNQRAANEAAGTLDSSKRATAAWGCAIDAGRAAEYHKIIFDNQPEKEGQGYSDVTLLTLGSQVVPPESMKSFANCVQSGKYLQWAKASDAQFTKKGITSTPTVFINDKEVKPATLFEQGGKTLLAQIAAATKK
jgi:protein-disulfide isomerase